MGLNSCRHAMLLLLIHCELPLTTELEFKHFKCGIQILVDFQLSTLCLKECRNYFICTSGITYKIGAGFGIAWRGWIFHQSISLLGIVLK